MSYTPDIIKQTARDLRKNMTLAEKILWREIRDKKIWIKFMKQKPVYLYTENNKHDRYIIPDFISVNPKIIIEVDWKIHNIEQVTGLDIEKEKLLIQKWFKILRYTNDEIIRNITSVIQNITIHVSSCST